MLLSLDVLFMAFGKRGVSREFIADIKRDLRKIKHIYQKERGLFKRLRLTNMRIIDCYLMQWNFDYGNEVKSEIANWKEFVHNCEIGGADFLEQYL